MAGTVVTTEERIGTIKKVAFDWLSDGAGAADATTTAVGGYDGQLLGVKFIPDTGGTAPDNLYDVALNDAGGYDLLHGQGANLSDVNTVVLLSNLGQITNDQLTLAVTNAGAANGGIIQVFIR